MVKTIAIFLFLETHPAVFQKRNTMVRPIFWFPYFLPESMVPPLLGT